MSFIDKLAHSLGRRDEVPNQEAVNDSNKADFIKVLEKRMEDLSGGGLTRVKKVIKQAQQNK